MIKEYKFQPFLSEFALAIEKCEVVLLNVAEIHLQ